MSGSGTHFLGCRHPLVTQPEVFWQQCGPTKGMEMHGVIKGSSEMQKSIEEQLL